MYIKITQDFKVHNKWTGGFTKEQYLVLEGDFKTYSDFLMMSMSVIPKSVRRDNHANYFCLNLEGKEYKDVAVWYIYNVIRGEFDKCKPKSSWWRFWE